MRLHAFVFLIVFALPSLAQVQPGWIADSRTGCKIWNDSPKPKETITWSGKCLNDLADGPGVLQWYLAGKPNGKYEGSYKNGKEHGKGEYFFSNKGRYKGDWKDGKMDGGGLLTTPTGVRYEGEFKDSKMHGRGVLTNKEVRYEGSFKNGKPNGNGTAVFKGGEKVSGLWIDGCFSGGGQEAAIIKTLKECGYE